MSNKLLPRIITGKYKNARLTVPSGSRPVTERFKHVVFNLLGERIVNAKCLDLFSGSGSFGVEALSRGAESVTFVDSNPKVVEIIKQNLEKLQVPANLYKVIRRSYTSQANAEPGEFDIVFADPPFPKFDSIQIASIISCAKVNTGLVLLKAPLDDKNLGLTALTEKLILKEKIGKNVLYILKN